MKRQQERKVNEKDRKAHDGIVPGTDPGNRDGGGKPLCTGKCADGAAVWRGRRGNRRKEAGRGGRRRNRTGGGFWGGTFRGGRI